MSEVRLDSLGRRNKGWSINKLGRGGRPKEFDLRISLSISQEDYDLLKIRAKRDGISASELVRLFIVWGLEG